MRFSYIPWFSSVNCPFFLLSIFPPCTIGLLTGFWIVHIFWILFLCWLKISSFGLWHSPFGLWGFPLALLPTWENILKDVHFAMYKAQICTPLEVCVNKYDVYWEIYGKSRRNGPPAILSILWIKCVWARYSSFVEKLDHENKSFLINDTSLFQRGTSRAHLLISLLNYGRPAEATSY